MKITIRSKEPALLPGDWIKVTAVLRGPPGPLSPGAFDFRQMYWFDRIGGVGFSIRKPIHIDPQRRNTVGERLRLSAAKFRAQIVRRVQATLPGQEGAIASALMAGERGAIDKQDTQALRDSGLAHLLAISGLHMGLAGFGIFVAVRRLLALSEPLALSYPIKKVGGRCRAFRNSILSGRVRDGCVGTACVYYDGGHFCGDHVGPVRNYASDGGHRRHDYDPDNPRGGRRSRISNVVCRRHLFGRRL